MVVSRNKKGRVTVSRKTTVSKAHESCFICEFSHIVAKQPADNLVERLQCWTRFLKIMQCWDTVNQLPIFSSVDAYHVKILPA